MDLSQYYANVGGTIYNKGRGAQGAFATEQDFFRDSGQTSFQGLKFDNNWTVPGTQNIDTKKVDVSLTGSPTTTSGVLSQSPVTTNDIQSMYADFQKRQEAYMAAMTKVSAEQQAAQQQYNQYQTQADQLQLDSANVQMRAQAGLNAISDKPIAMAFQTGQKASVGRQANQALQTIGVQQQALGVNMNAAARNLQNFESARQNTLRALEQSVQFGQQNIALQLQLDSIKKKEQNEALTFALSNNIDKPFFLVGATVYETGTGRPFTSEQDFQARTGMSVEQAGQQGLIQSEIETPDERAMAFDREQFEFEKYATMRGLNIDEFKAANGGGAGGLTLSQALSYQNQIQDNMRVDPAIKNYTALVDFGVPSVMADFESGNANSVTDTILMRTLAKVTDPTTGVREGEYETFESAIGALGRLTILPDKWVGNGRLTEEGRKQMARQIQDRYNAALSEYGNSYGYYRNQASTVPGVTIPPPYKSANIIPQDIEAELDAEFQKFMQPFNSPQSRINGNSLPARNSNASTRTFSSKSTSIGQLPKIPVKYEPLGPLATKNPAPYGVVAGYDITNYATDPTHEKSVYTFYSKMPDLKTPANVDKYIQSLAPGSPVRAQDVLDAARQYDVDPKLMVAIMRQDSSLGTAGKAVRTKNPGNVGNTDSGATQGYKTWRDGVFAVARNLSKRKVRVTS